MAQQLERFPLFPLGLVLLPGEALPLHIFEDRYKQMIGECLDEDREFGIVWLADDALKEIGCAARITRVLERFDDGRLNILVEGTTPFRLERRIGDMAYPAGDIVLLDDEPGSDDVALERARTAYADLVAAGRTNSEVAATLFLAERTVASHLTRVYAKLGIRSRSELAATRQASDGRSRSPAPPPAPRS